jgi:hypothetical protein
MVVWGYPCESKSSPAHYSKIPHLNRWGIFLPENLLTGLYDFKNIAKQLISLCKKYAGVGLNS